MLIITALLKAIPYTMNAISPSLLAIFLEGCVEVAAFQLYTMAESTMVADLSQDAQAIAIGNARVKSATGAAHSWRQYCQSADTRSPFSTRLPGKVRGGALRRSEHDIIESTGNG